MTQGWQGGGVPWLRLQRLAIGPNGRRNGVPHPRRSGVGDPEPPGAEEDGSGARHVQTESTGQGARRGESAGDMGPRHSPANGLGAMTATREQIRRQQAGKVGVSQERQGVALGESRPPDALREEGRGGRGPGARAGPVPEDTVEPRCVKGQKRAASRWWGGWHHQVYDGAVNGAIVQLSDHASGVVPG